MAQVCCTESRPAWLMVSLGAMRPLAALQLFQSQDMTYSLAVANASDGPFVQVASQTCETCAMNNNLGRVRQSTFRLARVTAAAYIRVTITWSSGGGVGGCNDLCDWATNIFGLKAFSPGLLLDNRAPAAASSSPPQLPADTCNAGALSLSDADMESSLVLAGDATRLPMGTGMRGASSVLLTPPEPQRFGAVEYSRIIRFPAGCKCRSLYTYSTTLYTKRITVSVWLGGSASMPGEGLVISLVDAARQTPGQTVFKRGCGTRPALPEASVSIVLDTSDSDPSCDEPGTGMRMVASLEGGEAPPLLLCSTLRMSTAGFRTGAWIPVQIDVHDYKDPLRNDTVAYTVGITWVDGGETIDPIVLRAEWPKLRAANVSLESFYVVVSARTGATGGDRHAVSGVHVQDCPAPDDLENWAGLRQPFTPPPTSPPWRSAPTPPQEPATVRSAARLGALSFGAALACTLGVLVSAATALRRLASQDKHVIALDKVVTSERDEAWLLHEPSETPAAKQQALPRPSGEHQRSMSSSSDGTQQRTSGEAARSAEFDVYLSCRCAYGVLADSLYDKLRLSGLRVFIDSDDPLAGRPFDAEHIRVMRATPVYAPVVTLPGLQSLGATATGCSNSLLAELLAALCLHDAGAVRLIHPLLVGPETEAGWASLLDEPSYGAALAALPDAASAATAALVDAALRRAGAAPMPPHIAALSVRDVLAAAFGGAPFALACPLQDLGLCVSLQYVPPVWAALRRDYIARRGLK